MGKFDNFNKKVNLNDIQNELANTADKNGTGDYPEVEKGQYRVQLVKMEVGECGPNAKTPGAPMLKAEFKIVPCDKFGNKFKNAHLFFNRVLYAATPTDKWDTAKAIKSAIGWLETLEPSDNIPPITFEDYDQFADLVLDIAEDISILLYDVTYDPNNFNSIKIEEVYE